MMAEKLPQKRSTVGNGLRKRPQFEQIVNYIANGQEKITYPDRQAKLIRNHPFMTQLDFFDMQEDQHRMWEEQVRQREAIQLAGPMGITAAQARAAAGPYRGGGGGGGPMGGGGGGGYGPINNRGGRRGGGGVVGPAGPQVGPSAAGPKAAAAAEARAAAAAGAPPTGAGMAGTYGPVRYGGAPGAGPARRHLNGTQDGHLAPGVADQLARQDAASAAAADQLLTDATERARQETEREHARRSAAASAAAASLYPTGVTPQQETSEEAAARYAREWAAQQGAASGQQHQGQQRRMMISSLLGQLHRRTHKLLHQVGKGRDKGREGRKTRIYRSDWLPKTWAQPST